MKELAVIIPMYNEELNAERCVRAVCAELDRSLPGTELLVVNDGSSDNTMEVLARLGRENLPFSFISHSPNRGYGGALVAGMRRAKEIGFEYGLIMDSDLTNDPALIPRFASELSSGEWDLVKASRYIPGGAMSGVPLYRRAITVVGNIIASRLFRMGIKDCTNGFHAVRLSLLVELDFAERGFPFLLEELYQLKKKKARSTEIPYVLTARENGEGVSKFSYSLPVLWNYLKYALRASLVR